MSATGDLSRVVRGILAFGRTRETSTEDYYAMRRLFVRTRGRSNDWLSRVVGARHRNPARDAGSRIEGIAPEASVRQAVLARLKTDGYALLEEGLSEATCDTLTRFALETPVRYLDGDRPGAWSDDEILFDREHPRSNRYQFRLEQVIQSEEVLRLAFDDSLHAIAGDYLGADPILDLITMWWSAPGAASLESAAAQSYHFDMDRLKFLKAFFYLTDVTPSTGPHCFVRGSHRRLPQALARDGRHTDDAVRAAFGTDAEVEICGPRGTILIADTRGFHKGKPLDEGDRLILQLEYSNSLFGAPYERVPIGRLRPEYRERARRAPRRFSGVFHA